MKPTLSRGYLRVHFFKDGKQKFFSVHRLVALAFIPNPDNKPQINHIDGNKLNNYVGNLEWAIRSENQQHAVANNLVKFGEDSSIAKLTNEQAEYIRNNPDGLTGKQLAEKFSVAPITISKIQLGSVTRLLKKIAARARRYSRQNSY